MHKNIFIIKKAIKFIIIVIIVDSVLGIGITTLFEKQTTGKWARIKHSMENRGEDILVFGNSQAIQHYVPEVFEQHLNQTCYNAGVKGQSIIFQKGLQQIIMGDYLPQTIILNIDPDWLFYREHTYTRLSDFYPFYLKHKNVLSKILSIKDKTINLKMLSRGLQMNSTIIHIINYYFNPQMDYQGYLPLYNAMKGERGEKIGDFKISKSNSTSKIDSNCSMAFRHFLRNAINSNIQLILIIPPTLDIVDYSINESLSIIKTIATDMKVDVIDYSNSDTFIYKYNLFNDSRHLNDKGAHLFSEMVCDSMLLLR
jgi:hypothetical protein